MASTGEVVSSAPVPPARPAQKRSRNRWGLFRLGDDIPHLAYAIIAVLSFAIPIGLWCYYSYSGKVDSYILPTPTAVGQAALRVFHDGDLWPDTKISLYRIGMGFFWSAVLAIPIGILMGSFKIFEAAHEPLVGFIRYVPVPALVPLVMFSAGIDEQAKILLIFLGTYFQMVLVVADVTRHVPREWLNAARTLGANPLQLLFSIVLPATLPGILDTCRTMIGWAWTYLVIAEVVACDSGLGYLIVNAQRHTRTDEMFVGIVMLGLLGLITDMLFKIIQPRILPWAETQKA